MNRLYIVTNDYPYGNGDSNFVLPELKYLKDRFRVIVISTSLRNTVESEILDGVEYRHFQLQLTMLKKIKYFFSFFTYKLCWSELVNILKNSKNNRIGRIYKSIEFFACSEEFYKFLLKKMSGELSGEKGIFLNYWCNAYSLSLIFHGKYRGLKKITRLHGCDLYEERYAFGRQPFKELINRKMDHLIFASYLAREYYLKVHPKLNKEKTSVCCLGVERTEGEKRVSEKMYNEFLIVSCSAIIPLKRVELIIEGLALLHIKGVIKWVHFGEGKQRKKIEKLAEEKLGNSSSLNYEFKGMVRNEEIRRFYDKYRPDCFITASSIEGGSPVSIMEALASGIPVIGTDVGDISFMVDGNGVLLPRNPDAPQIASAVEKILNSNCEEKEIMRKRSLEIWNERYNLKKNEKKFVNLLNQIISGSKSIPDSKIE